MELEVCACSDPRSLRRTAKRRRPGGEAAKVTDPATLEKVAGLYRELGWPARVEGSAFTAPYSAPSAGPPPWDLYRFTYTRVLGLSPPEPNGATPSRSGRVSPP